MASLLTQNSKIKGSGSARVIVYNFGIPAFMSETGFKTCPMAGICAGACYARSGFYIMYKTVRNALEWRLKRTQSKQFHWEMRMELNKALKRHKGKQLIIRIHDSGDFYSLEYYRKWEAIMLEFPDIRFYAYTKMVKMFKELDGTLPANFTLIYSFGGKQDKLIDRSKDRHSFVFADSIELKRKKYIDTSKNDLNAIGKNHRIGLVYHHPKSFENTGWSKL
jgi:hypothetical protein